MVAAGLGLGALLIAVPSALEALRWLGVSYLVVLGLNTWRGPRGTCSPNTKDHPQTTTRSRYLQGFAVSLGNPKAVLFFAGLFPAFIRADHPVAPQLLLLGTTFVVLDGSSLSLWALSAQHLGRVAGRMVWTRRLGGFFLLSAAAALAAK
jgi:threonine/homoserine/homoserine lactone efflux protein